MEIRVGFGRRAEICRGAADGYAFDGGFVVDAEGERSSDAAADVTPAAIPDLYRGEPLVLAAKLDKLAGSVEIKGRIGDRPWVVTLPLGNAAEGKGLSKVWARRKISDAEVARTLRQANPEDADRTILALKGPATKIIDAQGRNILPGLYDSHTHPTGASSSELVEPLPELDSLTDVFAYIQKKTKELPEGDWIVLRFAFPTRLKSNAFSKKIAEASGSGTMMAM